MIKAQSNNGATGATRIFVVDDEPMLLELATAILKPSGFELLTFRDPKMALAELPAVKPAVLVTDYAMGGMNGMELLQECRQINPKLKVLLLSGTVDENIYADAKEKPNAFLAKPYRISEFIGWVQRLAAG